MDSLLREDALVALIQLLYIGLERADLQDEEVATGLELARAGRLLRSSEGLAIELAEYQQTHA